MHQELAHTFSRQSRRAAARKAAPLLACARVSARPCIRAITTVDAFGNALGNGIAEQAGASQNNLGSGLKPTREIAETWGNRDIPSFARNGNPADSTGGSAWSPAQQAALEFALRNPGSLLTDDAMPMTQAQRYAQTFGGEAIEVANKRSPSLSELQDNADRLYAQRWASDKTPIPYPQYGWDIRKHLIAGNALQEQFANKTAPSDQAIAETLSGLQQKQQELDQQLMRQGSSPKGAELVLAINSLRRTSQDVVAALIDSDHPMGRDTGANQLVAMAAQYAANGVSGAPGLGLRGLQFANTSSFGGFADNRLNGRYRGVDEAANVRADGVNKPRLFVNLFPEDVPRTPNIISNEILSKISNRKLAYVVTESGSLVVGKDSPLQGHIDLAGGAGVLAAGRLSLHNGEIRFIDNFSGHYQPSGIEAQRAAERAFRNLGFNVDGKYIERSFK